MKKTIFDPEAKIEILKRLKNLSHDTQPRWGVMKPNQMLRHLIEANKISTGELETADRSNLFTKTLIRYFILNSKVPSIKQIQKRPIVTFPEINVVERNIATADFETEKENFKKDIERVINAKIFAAKSPVMGKMSREDWGKLTYSHANYHLTQFGL